MKALLEVLYGNRGMKSCDLSLSQGSLQFGFECVVCFMGKSHHVSEPSWHVVSQRQSQRFVGRLDEFLNEQVGEFFALILNKQIDINMFFPVKCKQGITLWELGRYQCTKP